MFFILSSLRWTLALFCLNKLKSTSFSSSNGSLHQLCVKRQQLFLPEQGPVFLSSKPEIYVWGFPHRPSYISECGSSGAVLAVPHLPPRPQTPHPISACSRCGTWRGTRPLIPFLCHVTQSLYRDEFCDLLNATSSLRFVVLTGRRSIFREAIFFVFKSFIGNVLPQLSFFIHQRRWRGSGNFSYFRPRSRIWRPELCKLLSVLLRSLSYLTIFREMNTKVARFHKNCSLKSSSYINCLRSFATTKNRLRKVLIRHYSLVFQLPDKSIKLMHVS